MTEGTSAELEQRLLAANAAFYAAFNARDIDAMEAVWARDARLVCIHPGANALIGREAIMASWAAILGNPVQAPLRFGGEMVVVIDSGAATVVCRELAQGAPIVATNTFVEEDGSWRLVVHHASGVAR